MHLHHSIIVTLEKKYSKYYEEQRDILNHRLYNYYNLSIAYTFNFGKRIPFTQKNIDERVDSSILHSN